MGLIILTFIFFSVIVAAMAVGFIFQGKCMPGSCGGQAVYGPDGELLNCDTCPVRKEREESAEPSA